jgi:hypothetical protein
MAKTTKKHKHSKKLSRHHIIPKSRGGSSKLENLSDLTINDHRSYHHLFENKTPCEIIELLVDKYWNGKWDYVNDAYRRNNNVYN